MTAGQDLEDEDSSTGDKDARDTLLAALFEGDGEKIAIAWVQLTVPPWIALGSQLQEARLLSADWAVRQAWAERTRACFAPPEVFHLAGQVIETAQLVSLHPGRIEAALRLLVEEEDMAGATIVFGQVYQEQAAAADVAAALLEAHLQESV